MNKIEKFIEINLLDFTSSDSGLNYNCVVIAGYALHLGLSLEELIESMEEIEDMDLDIDAYPYSNNHVTLEEELIRVYNYADSNDYGNWWSKEDAKKMYKF